MLFITSTFLFSYLGGVTVLRFKNQILNAIFDNLFQNLIWIGLGALLTISWKKISDILSNMHIVNHNGDNEE